MNDDENTDDMTVETTPTLVDGRTRRRRRNVDAVVDAVIELASADNLDPTSEEIAAIAGISHRSIYRYFDSRAELLEAAIARAFETVSAEVLREPSGDAFDQRVEAFVSERIEMYRRFRPIAKAASAHSAHVTVSRGLERTRSLLRKELANHFAVELGRLDLDEQRLVLPVVDALFQFEALEYLSGNVGLDDEQIQWSLARHLHRHLS